MALGNNDIAVTTEELYKLKNAFQDEQFVKLFADYVQDINSSESRKSYEEEIISLEKERGYEVKFVHPDPCYVLKLVTNQKKIFINICKNENAGIPSSTKKKGGSEWKIPVIISKPREDVDRKGLKCQVFDVIFHPDTLEKALNNASFKNIVEDTAVSMVSENFSLSLDIKTAKRPKMKYKGKPPHTVLRQKTGSKISNVPCESLEEYLKNHNKQKLEEKPPQSALATLPKYTVKYRDIIDMKDFSLMGYTDKCAPKEIIVEIMLPKAEKGDDVELDIFERKLQLKSCENLNHCYKLELDLSYAVIADRGRAKFDKQKRILSVQLILKDRGIPSI